MAHPSPCGSIPLPVIDSLEVGAPIPRRPLSLIATCSLSQSTRGPSKPAQHHRGGPGSHAPRGNPSRTSFVLLLYSSLATYRREQPCLLGRRSTQVQASDGYQPWLEEWGLHAYPASGIPDG